MQSISAEPSLAHQALDILAAPPPEWQIVQQTFSEILDTLGCLASSALIGDGLTSFLLENRLLSALARPFDKSVDQWPIVHLIEAGRHNLLEVREAEWYFYQYGGEKAVAALYQATMHDKKFFNDFNELLHHSKVSLIGRIQHKVVPHLDSWVQEYQEPKGITIVYFKISRRRCTRHPAKQKQPTKHHDLEQLYQDEVPPHSAVSVSKRRRLESPSKEGNTLIPDPARLSDLSDVQASPHQPLTASVPVETQYNSQIEGSDASDSQQNPQQITRTIGPDTGQGVGCVNMSLVGFSIDEFYFDNLDVDLLKSPDFQVDYPDDTTQTRIVTSHAEDLLQYSPRIDELHFQGLFPDLYGIDYFRFEGLDIPYQAQEMVHGTH